VGTAGVVVRPRVVGALLADGDSGVAGVARSRPRPRAARARAVRRSACRERALELVVLLAAARGSRLRRSARAVLPHRRDSGDLSAHQHACRGSAVSVSGVVYVRFGVDVHSLASQPRVVVLAMARDRRFAASGIRRRERCW